MRRTWQEDAHATAPDTEAKVTATIPAGQSGIGFPIVVERPATGSETAARGAIESLHTQRKHPGAMRWLVPAMMLAVIALSMGLSACAEMRTTGDTRAFWELRERAAP